MTGRWRQKFRERDAMRARLRLVMRQPNTMNAFLQTASNHISRRMFCAARTLCVSFEMRMALLCAMGLITAAAVQDVVLKADETHARYFEQLRSRSLFSLAEGYAIFRLSQSNLSPSLQTELTVELSRTLAEHACFLPEDQQQEFWRRARATVDDRRTKDETSPEVPLLAIQSAMVTVCEVEWLKIECELQPLKTAEESHSGRMCHCDPTTPRVRRFAGQFSATEFKHPGSNAGTAVVLRNRCTVASCSISRGFDVTSSCRTLPGHDS